MPLPRAAVFWLYYEQYLIKKTRKKEAREGEREEREERKKDRQAEGGREGGEFFSWSVRCARGARQASPVRCPKPRTRANGSWGLERLTQWAPSSTFEDWGRICWACMAASWENSGLPICWCPCCMPICCICCICCMFCIICR